MVFLSKAVSPDFVSAASKFLSASAHWLRLHGLLRRGHFLGDDAADLLALVLVGRERRLRADAEAHQRQQRHHAQKPVQDFAGRCPISSIE